MSAVAAAAAGIAVLAAAGALRRHRPPVRAADASGDDTPAVEPAAPQTSDWAMLLDAAAAEVRSGTGLGDAWMHALRRHPVHGSAVAPGRALEASLGLVAGSRDEAVVLQAVGAAAALGGPMAMALDAGAALLRERAAARADAAAHAAQARLSAKVLTAVPIGFAAWSALTSDAFRAGIASAAGGTSVVFGAALNAVGWWWMTALVGRAAP